MAASVLCFFGKSLRSSNNEIFTLNAISLAVRSSCERQSSFRICHVLLMPFDGFS